MRMFLPALPIWSVGAGAKAVGSKKRWMVRSPRGRLPSPMRFGRLSPTPAPAELKFKLGVKGVPVRIVAMPFN